MTQDEMIESMEIRKYTSYLGANWKIELLVDDDDHLSIYVNNLDGTEVIMTECDAISTEKEFGIRLTSQGIEDEYKKQQAEEECTHL